MGATKNFVREIAWCQVFLKPFLLYFEVSSLRSGMFGLISYFSHTYFYLLARAPFHCQWTTNHILSLLGNSPDQLGIPAVTKSSSLEHLQQDLDLWSWDLDAKDVGLLWVLKLLH